MDIQRIAYSRARDGMKRLLGASSDTVDLLAIAMPTKSCFIVLMEWGAAVRPGGGIPQCGPDRACPAGIDPATCGRLASRTLSV